MEGQKVFGYIRVSTREQNMDRQRIALEETGIPPERIYIDSQARISTGLNIWKC